MREDDCKSCDHWDDKAGRCRLPSGQRPCGHVDPQPEPEPFTLFEEN
jgi:hypothetical protein